MEGVFGLIKQQIAVMHGLKTRKAYAAHLDKYCYRPFHGADKEPLKFWKTFLGDVRRYRSDVVNEDDIANDDDAASSVVSMEL